MLSYIKCAIELRYPRHTTDRHLGLNSDFCFLHIMTSTPQVQTFAPNERVLCYHGPLVYEAKVLKSEVWDEATTKNGILGANYFVHYKGWKQTYVQFSRYISLLDA